MAFSDIVISAPDQSDTTATATAPDVPPPKPILSTSFNKIGANGTNSEPWDPGAGYDTVTVPAATTRLALNAVKNAVTGEASVEHPEIPPLNLEGLGLSITDPKALGILAHMAVSRDPTALANVIHERVPEAKFSWDKYDEKGNAAPDANMIVQTPGGPQMYVDRPGLTPQKVLFYGPQGVAAAYSGGTSALGLGVRQAIQSALSHLSSWGLGGADSPIDLTGTALAGALPMALGVGGLAAMKGVDWLTSGPATADAAKIAEGARSAYNWGFSAKEGNITGDPATLAKEDLIANATGSPEAQKYMRDVQNANSAQNLVNKRTIIGNAAGDVAAGEKAAPDYIPDQNAFGDTLNAAVTKKAGDLTNAATAAWDKLGPVSTDSAAGKAVSFSPDVSNDVWSAANATNRRFYGVPGSADGTFTADQVAAMGDAGSRVAAVYANLRRVLSSTTDEYGNPTLRGFNLGQLQDMRQQLGGIAGNTTDRQAAAWAAQLKRSVDDAIAGAEITPGKLIGDAGKLTDFRAANAATRAKYDFTEPRDNPAAARFIAGVTGDGRVPYSGGKSINNIFGGGGGPSGMTGNANGIITHLVNNLGDDASKPLAGALTTRTLYGSTPPAAAEAAPPTSDYNSAAARIRGQLSGTGAADVSNAVLSPGTQTSLQDYARALDVLGASNRPGAMRLNAPGSGYVQMLTGLPEELPFVGKAIKRYKSLNEAQDSMQKGAEITQRAVDGATTPAGLGVSVPRGPSLLNNPNLPYYSWRPEAFRAGVPPLKIGGGLLLGQDLSPNTASDIRGP